MELTVQRRLAAAVLNCSPKRVWMDSDHASEIKEAITKADIRGIVVRGFIQIKPMRGISRGRVRKSHIQRAKGRKRGHGSRKGRATARLPRKVIWMNTVRAQRDLLRELRERGIVEPKTYRMLYSKSKGGFFRSRRHIKLFIDEHNLAVKKDVKLAKK